MEVSFADILRDKGGRVDTDTVHNYDMYDEYFFFLNLHLYTATCIYDKDAVG